jgi:gliding motility-associated-like protein
LRRYQTSRRVQETDFGSTINGLGVYQNTNPAFPVGSSGIILASGNAQLAPGPNTSIVSSGNPVATWLSTPELDAYFGAGANFRNASVLQFNFIPNGTSFDMDFLFASEEYGTFQCESNDTFVVLLTNLNTGVTTNVALIPSTLLPVTVQNIRNNSFNSGCPSLNDAFFGAFNGGANAAGAAINYNGQTVLLHASGTLDPTAQYNIKFIIADSEDGDFDSAVFLPAGSLNLGQQVFAQDMTLANGNPACFGQSYVLDTELNPIVYDFQWSLNGNPLAGETGPSLTVTAPGEYTVAISRPDLGCNSVQTINIEYTPAINATEPVDLIKCQNAGGVYTYQLSQNTPIVTAGLGAGMIVTYHATQADAIGDTNALPGTYDSPSGVAIWVRIENPATGCYALRSFDLLSVPGTVAGQPQNLVQCESAQGSGTAIFNLLQQNDMVLNGAVPTDHTITYHTSLANANADTNAIALPESFTSANQTIYVRLEQNFDATCYSIKQFDLIVHALPVLPASGTINQCNSYTLPVLANGNYYTGNGGTGTMIAGGTAITVPQVLYMYAVDPVTGCSNQATLNVNIISAGTAPADVVACESYTLPVLTLGEYRDAPAGGGSIIPAGTVITAPLTTIYYFIPTAASCTQNNNFTVTITDTPVVTELADQFSCGPYTLPVLPNGQNYYTGPNGTGTALAAGAVINTSQTLYIYVSHPSNPACTAQSDFVVNVTNVNITPSGDIERCAAYALPALTVGNYYTGPGGTGSVIPAGTLILTPQTVYIYAVSPFDPTCFQEDSFVVTIYPRPNVPVIPNVSACENYTLPALPSGANYYTGPNGTGTMLAEGTLITTSQTIYAYAVAGPPLFCARDRSFTVTIINVDAITPEDITVCGIYPFPALPDGATYWSGPNGTGTQYLPGTFIMTSQTVYVRVVSNTDPVCVQESSFVVTIKQRPNIPVIADVVTCDPYPLPALTVGNYYTGQNGTGTLIPAGTPITNTITLYAYAETGGTPNCSRQRAFTITVLPASIAPANVTACTSYTLPALPRGNYFTAPNGGGTQLAVGTVITTPQTIYVYMPVTYGSNCTGDDSFTVNIVPPVTADDPADVVTCVTYNLPALTNGNYYTDSMGTGTMLPAGTPINSTQTIYVYNNQPGAANCAVENSFTVTFETIDIADIADVTVCETGYELEPLTIGNYYTGPGGTGTQLNEGDIITTTGTIYIYGQTTTTPPCSDEESFTVTVIPSPVIDTPANVGVCGNYTLPALTNGDYYTAPGATGTQLFAGQVISASQTLYIFAETGGNPNCASEHSFDIIINPGAPQDVTACGQYELPPLAVGSYFSAPAGTGTQYPVGHIINSTQQVYVYVPMTTTPNCTDFNSFMVNVVPYPVLDPVAPVVECDSYILPALTVGNYYTGPGGTGTMLAAGDAITTSQTVYVYAEAGPTPCITEDSFTVTIYNTPLVDARSDALACEEFILDALLVGNYYTGPGGTGTMLTAGTSIQTTQTIYIYAENPLHPACNAENSFLVEVFSITADNPADEERCDNYILPALTIGNYYALSGGPDVPGQVMYNAGDVITTTTTLYVYAETGGRINCTDENSLTITIWQTPVVDDIQGDVAQCNAAFVLPALTVGNYYTGPLGTGTQLAAGSSISTPTTIYVYAEHPASNGLCFDQHSFFVDVNFVDVTAPAGGNWCGFYTLPALATGNYYTGAGGTGTMLNEGDLITTSQDIYVYHEAGTTLICSDEEMFHIEIIQAPIPNQPAPLVECEVDNDGHALFNLVTAMDFALGGQSNAAASIHETLASAEAGVNAIPDPANYFAPAAAVQTLYIRLYSTVTDCYNIVALTLIINPRPEATEPTDYNVCDDNTDGFALFNLATKTPFILGTLDPAQFTVEYYTSLADAQAGLVPIANLTNYNSDTRTLYVRVENNATGCFDIVTLELIVNPLPVATPPTPYTLCDINNPGDEIEIFNLTTKIPEIIGTQNGIEVTFHQSMAEAQGDINAVATPTAYTNDGTVDALFARVEFIATGCYRVVLLDVRVEPLPLLLDPQPEDFIVCDTDEDGVRQFNLVELADIMINDGLNISLSFYYTEQNALDGQFAIINPATYVNEVPFDQPLWVVATNTLTGCKSNPKEIHLVITPAPELPVLPDLALCDQDNNGITAFNLTQQNSVIEIFMGAAPGTVNIRYYSSFANAEAGITAITNDTAYNGFDGQEIFVRVEDLNPASQCFAITSFTLHVDTPLALVTPPMYRLCETGTTNDGIELFDLTTLNNTILGPAGVGQGHIVEYYFSHADAVSGLNIIANPETFVNTVAGTQTLHVKVITNPGGCISYTTVTVKVLPLPTPDTTPDALQACDTGSDGQESFNLTLAEADIRNNDNTTTITYHVTLADAEGDVNAIPDPTNHVTATGIVYVRVEANTNNPLDPRCYKVVELQVTVNPLPALGNAGLIDPYPICEAAPSDGFAIFDFNTHNDDVLNGADITGYTFKYFLSQANALANTNALPLAGWQNTTATQQTIWVRVQNTATGCINIGSFDIFVEVEAIAHDVDDVEICDLDGANDGITTFDLTQFDAEVLNGQPQGPGQYIVQYFIDDPQANDNQNPIADPVNFQAEGDQLIYIRVFNDATISKCSDYTTVLVRVEQRPIPVIAGGTICVDYMTGEVVRDLAINTGLDNTHTFQWFLNGTVIPGSNGPIHYAVEPGNYTVIATSALGCISDPVAPVTVLMSGPPSAVGTGYTVSNYFSDNQVITVNVVGHGEYEYRLDADGQWQEDNVFTNVSPGTHQVYVRDTATNSPCSEFVLILEDISTVNYPNYFTPNGDGHHDTWNIIRLGDDNTDAKIYIFDRYGKLVKQISSQGDGWDGTMNGSEMPATDYWFTAIYRETVNGVPMVKEFKAHFSLKR